MANKNILTDLTVDGVVSASEPVSSSNLTTKNYTDTTFEFDLGDPSSDGQVLSSTTGGTRSWVDLPSGGGSPEFSITQTAHGFSIGDPVAEVGGTWVAANTATDPYTAEGIVTTVPDANSFTATIVGELTLTAHGYTVNEWYYLASNGSYTTTVPSTEGDIIQFCFKVLDANRIYIRISQPEVVAAAATPGVTVHNNLTGRSASDAHPTSAITGLDTTLAGKEDDLGNPSNDGDVLSSTTAGVRSWITPPAGVTVHNNLTGRSTADAHPQSAITDLVTDLGAKEPGLGTPAGNGFILQSNTFGGRSWINPTDLGISTATQTALNLKEDDLGTPASNGMFLSSTTGDVRSWAFPSSDVIVNGSSVTGADVSAALDTLKTDVGTNTTDIGTNTTDIAQINTGNEFIVKTTDFTVELYHQNYEVTGNTVEITWEPGVNTGTYYDILYSGTGGFTYDWGGPAPSYIPPIIAGHIYRVIKISGAWSMSDITELQISPPGTSGQVLASTTAGVKSWVSKENDLGNPSTNGQVLASTTSGTRSWTSVPSAPAYYTLTVNNASTVNANLSFLSGKPVTRLRVTATMNYSAGSTIPFDAVAELQVNYNSSINAFRRGHLCNAGAFQNQYYQTDLVLYSAAGLTYNTIQVNLHNASTNASFNAFYLNIVIEAEFL